MLIAFTVLFFFVGSSLADHDHDHDHVHDHDHDIDQVGDWVVISDWEEDQPAKSLEKPAPR